MSRNVRKRAFGHVNSSNIQINLCEVLPESSLGAFWTAKDAKFLDADNEESSAQSRWAHMSDDTFSDVHMVAHL